METLKMLTENSVIILGEITVLLKVNSSLIYEKILVFKKTRAIVHDLLIGMNILRFAELSFVKKEISFNHAIISRDWRKARPDNSIALRLLSNKIFYDEKASANLSTKATDVPQRTVLTELPAVSTMATDVPQREAIAKTTNAPQRDVNVALRPLICNEKVLLVYLQRLQTNQNVRSSYQQLKTKRTPPVTNAIHQRRMTCLTTQCHPFQDA